MTAFVAIPRAAAQQLLDDLHARIDSAHLTDVPVFPGIVELHNALAAEAAPGEQSAVASSIETLQAFEDSGRLLDEVESWSALAEAIALCVHELKRLRTLALWPDQLTPVLREVLGLMCFQLGPAAHVYQAAGEFVDGDGAALRRCAEDEQAFMLHKIVEIALAHGEAWPDLVQADLNRVKAIAAARKADTKA